MRLEGKGLWAYRLWELDKALQIAPHMDVSHILYKVGQGPLGEKAPFYIDNAAEIAQRIRAAGYTPLAWSFATLADPHVAAEIVIRAFDHGYAGFIFNAEGATSEQRANALDIGERLRAANIDTQRLYICSYPTPITHHPDIPFNELGTFCQGGLMPMAYGTYHLSPDIVIDQWTYDQNHQWLARQGLELPIYPVLGPYYDEHGQDKMTQADYQTWLDYLKPHNPSFFSIYTTSVIEPTYYAPTRAFVLGSGDAPVIPEQPTLHVRVVSPELGFLRIRAGKAVDHLEIAQVPDGTILGALEPPAEVRRKVGQLGAWLHVQLPNGQEGYAAAWYLRLQLEKEEPEPTLDAATHLIVNSPDLGLRVRSGPGITHTEIGWVPHGTVLESLEDPQTTAAKLFQDAAWLHVRTPARIEGCVAAWRLTLPDAPDQRKPVDDAHLSMGFSAWIFGMHAASIADDSDKTRRRIRSLFEQGGHRGWVLFTEAIGHDPEHLTLKPELRRRLWDWATSGYGVVVRLNNAYRPSGTLPHSSHYADFAEACACWIAFHLKHDEEPPNRYSWIVQIANEQNNPSEHPGDHGQIAEHITPQLYAQAFNLAYAKIKAVLPHIFVAPGAVDPYNSTPFPLLGNQRYRPLAYYQEMLDNIDALDALLLHAYTHGPTVAELTALTTFGDPFLGDHYFNFQTYRQFMERIPAKWKRVPVLITECNHICRPPNAPACDDPQQQGWSNANIGWVHAAYEEIHRWNQTPYLQQIWGLLLYRWLGDQWKLHDKSALHADFKQALSHDYRWRA